MAKNRAREGEKATKDLFQGKTYEELTKWSDFHARQYDAALGRWFGVDPQNQFASPYLAMGNNPVMFTDPDGEFVPLVIAGAALVGGGLNLWSNADKIKDWKSGLAYFASGAIGGALSVGTPGLGGSLTSFSNIGIDIATGNLPDLSNPLEAAKYVGFKALEGIGTAGVGSLTKAGVNGLKSIGNGPGLLRSFSVSGKMTGNMAAGYLLPEATLTLTRVPASQVAANAARIAAKGGTSVLGHYPEYVTLAKSLGAKRFNIPTNIWEGMRTAEKWGANQKFLDRMILRGDNIRLATPLSQVKPGSFYQQELNYLFGKGYKVSSNGLWLVK